MVFGADWDEPLPPQPVRAFTLDELRTSVKLAPPTTEKPDPNIVTIHLWVGDCVSCGERRSLKLGLCERCRPAARP